MKKPFNFNYHYFRLLRNNFDRCSDVLNRTEILQMTKNETELAFVSRNFKFKTPKK